MPNVVNAAVESQSEIAELSRRIDEQTRYFEAILSSISDFAYTFDRAGRFVFVNQALLDLWGLRLETALGKNFFDLQYPEELAERLQRQIQQVFETRQRVIDETAYTSPTGVTGHYEYIFSPFFGAGGDVELVVGTTRNITERKLAAEAIKRLSIRNLEILESITDAFFAIDQDWRFSYVNKQAETLLEREPGDLLGKIIWEVYPGLVGSEFEYAYQRAATAHVASNVSAFYPDHQRWYDVNVFPAENGITIYFKDTTERVRSEETIRQGQAETERQRRLYDTILSNTPDLAYVFDLNHRFTYANDILLRMWGRTWDEAIGKNCLELGYEPWHAEMHDREIEKVIATKQSIRGEVPFTGTFGRRIYDYIFVPVIGANGEVEAVAGTTRDITDHKQMEETLRDNDRRKDEFLATLAHELRNPLAPVRSGVEVLRRLGIDKPLFHETVGIIERQTNQIVHLVDDLLDISRISQGKIKLKKERIELKTAIDLALETSRHLIDEAKNNLTVSMPYKPIYLEADLTRLAQIFLNILNNAAKYSNPGGKIVLAAEREHGQAVIRISDTGLGIAPEMVNRIFDMFGQIASSDEEARGGLGIGLSVVKKLVEMHNGTVDVSSAGLGHGSVFTVRLPLVDPVTADSPNDQAQPEIGVSASRQSLATGEESAETETLKILVVDDNRDAVEMLTTLFTLDGHSVRSAFDGRSAIEIANSFQPEVCLCDIGLPEMNGFELAPHLRELLPEAILISVSGWGREQDRRRSREAGYDHHLVKPVQLEEIEKILKTKSGKRIGPTSVSPAS